MDLINQLNQKCIDLDNKVANLANLGRSLADAENKYKIALAQESLKLKENKMPVTLIDKVCYGIEKVASLRKERDYAEAIYKASQESINAIKLQIKILQFQIEKEYSLTKNM